MGIDFYKTKKHARTAPKRTVKSHNPYLRLLKKLYAFLERRTNSKFNQIVHHRLCTSRSNRQPISLTKLSKNMGGKSDKIAVIVGRVTDDPRMFEIPKMTVCALGFTNTARAHIAKYGGECITFDQLALRSPTGSNTVLLRGPIKSQKKFKYFGVPGAKGSHTRPRVRSKGRKFERARGRR